MKLEEDCYFPASFLIFVVLNHFMTCVYYIQCCLGKGINLYGQHPPGDRVPRNNIVPYFCQCPETETVILRPTPPADKMHTTSRPN